MIQTLSLISDFILDQMDNIWRISSGSWILMLPIVLWILDRLFNIFDILKR